MSRREEPTTIPDDDADSPPRQEPQSHPPAQVHVDVAGLSNQGKVRLNNEDHFLIARFGRFLEKLSSNLPPDEIPARIEEAGYGMLVADGVGGAAAGEEASRLAISAFVNVALSTPDWILHLDDDVLAQEVMRRAVERYRRVSAMLTERADADPSLEGFGTTLTLVLSLGQDVFVANVGDSRTYLGRQGSLRQLTRDHTAAQAMAEQGIIDQQAVATHRLRHVLTQAIGAHGREVEPEVQRLSLEDGDCLLLCTDGLTEMVKDEVIARILAEKGTAEETCQRLIAEALNAGGKDNVTVVVARYRMDPPPR